MLYMNSLLDQFTQKVLSKRKKLGLSQVALVELSQVSLPTIQKIESGRANPTLDVMIKIGNSLGFSLNINDTSVGSNHNEDGIAYIQEMVRNFNRRHLNSSRQNDELLASFLALKTHYPSIFQKLRKKTEIDNELSIKLSSAPGRLIKHARISLEKLIHLF